MDRQAVRPISTSTVAVLCLGLVVSAIVRAEAEMQAAEIVAAATVEAARIRADAAR